MERIEVEPVLCTVDVALMTLKGDQLMVALKRRDHEPYPDVFALPGGVVRPGEDATLEETAERVLQQKMGIKSPYLEQLITKGDAVRDPRGWSMSVSYYALVPLDVIEKTHFQDIRLADVDKKMILPFDHMRIVQSAVARLRNKSQYSSLPCHLAGETFTLPQLQKIYEAVMGVARNKSHFRKKIEEMGMLEEVKGQSTQGAANRPAQIYRLKKAYRENLAMLERGL